MQTLSVVIPVYNEEENIPHLIETLAPILESIENLDYEIIFTLDPSDDNTEETILKERSQNNRVKLLSFSRRVGQPIATLAGLHRCKGDAAVVMDADLQDPPEIIPDMVAKWGEGYDVVYATRKDRKYENIFRRLFGHLYYGVLNSLSGFVFGFIWMLLVLLKVFSCLYSHITVIGKISYSHLILMFLGIVQLISIGILGEYISRIYDQVKNRPLYIVDREEGF